MADGLAALASSARHVDLVVTDVMMPGLDGLGLLKEIQPTSWLRGTPVVLLSARAGPEAAAEAMEAGADDYVIKPFSTGELLARCRTSLELAQYRASEAASRARSALLAGVSHDMQTPLAVISSTLELLSQGDMPRGIACSLPPGASPDPEIRAAGHAVPRLVPVSTNEPLPVRISRRPSRYGRQVAAGMTAARQGASIRCAPPATPNEPSSTCTTSWTTPSGGPHRRGDPPRRRPQPISSPG